MPFMYVVISPIILRTPLKNTQKRTELFTTNDQECRTQRTEPLKSKYWSTPKPTIGSLAEFLLKTKTFAQIFAVLVRRTNY